MWLSFIYPVKDLLDFLKLKIDFSFIHNNFRKLSAIIYLIEYCFPPIFSMLTFWNYNYN